jgi:hypothetical protein
MRRLEGTIKLRGEDKEMSSDREGEVEEGRCEGGKIRR